MSARENLNADYIGAGVAFPLDINLQGELQLSSATANLEESIFVILGTNLGERAYRPEFGSRLSELVFEPMNRDTLLQLRLCVEEALEMWEPRIIVKDVRAIPDPVRGLVELEIFYLPRNTEDSYQLRSLVYPFYLQPGKE